MIERAIWIAVLAVGALLAGCGTEDVRDRGRREDIQFGIWQLDDDGAMRFTATTDVPNEEDQAYGWRVRVAESDKAVTVGAEIPDGGYVEGIWYVAFG